MECIELMIVVAIIGILAAIAIPAYQDYIGRSQVSEGPALLGGLKTPLVEAIGNEGLATGCDEPEGAVLSGQYVSGIVVAPVDETCVATATYASGINDNVADETIAFTFDPEDGSWECTTSLPAKFAPKSCTAGS